MKTLLLGANGQLGQAFRHHDGLASRGELVAGTRDGTLLGSSGHAHGIVADLSDLTALAALLDQVQPDIIVNAAAYTAVDRAEQDEALAMRINGEAVGVIGNWAARRGAFVVHYSTDYVFPGDATTPYAEHAAVGPMGAYGRSKLAGEILLAESGAPHFIFRTAWVYSAVGHNFLLTMLRLGASRDELGVVADQAGTPTDTRLIVEASSQALDQWLASGPTGRAALEGTYHLTARGETTWHGFAEALLHGSVERGLIERMPTVRAITTSEFPTPAKRPAYSVLDTSRFANTFAYQLPEWQVGVDRTLAALSTQSE